MLTGDKIGREVELDFLRKGSAARGGHAGGAAAAAASIRLLGGRPAPCDASERREPLPAEQRQHHAAVDDGADDRERGEHYLLVQAPAAQTVQQAARCAKNSTTRERQTGNGELGDRSSAAARRW